jgi:glycosyltransferase involved in cell wall biosynthesis
VSLQEAKPLLEKRLKVALAILYPIDPSRPTGGLQNVACNLVKGFQGVPEIELHVVHCTKDADCDHVAQDGSAFIHYLHAPQKRVVPNLVTSVLKARSELRRIEPDVVNAHASHYAAASVLAGYPTVYTIHGIMRKEAALSNDTWFDRSRYGLAIRYDDFALKRVTRVVAINPYVAQEYGSRVDDRWREIPVPIAEAYFTAPDRTVSGRILSAGTIIERKNGLALLEALKRVREAVPHAHVHFAGRVGEPEYFECLQKYIAESGLGDAVTFLGLMSLDKMVGAYGECAVLALTSRQETLPAVVLEAGAAWKPSVSVQVGGVEDLIADAESGFVVPQDDVDALADRLVRMLSDEPLRRGMGGAARARAERFRVRNIVAQYADLYREAAEAGRGK